MPKSRSAADSASGTVTGFFKDLTAGDAAAMKPLSDHFFPRLIRLASRTLGDGPQRVAEADDAVQSAFITFWNRVDQGNLQGPLRRENVWGLLAVMTVCTARKQLRREMTKKRGGGELPLPLFEADVTPGQAFDTLSPQEFDLHSEDLLLLLEEGLRPFAILRLMGHSNAEVAETMECTERTVERKLERIRTE